MADLKGKRFHFDGVDGTDLHFSECDPTKNEDELVVVRAERAQPGVPLRMGEHIGTFVETDDGHYEIEEVSEHRNGPAKVSNRAYRRGWEETFGKNGVN